jgi:hypothetical protein
MSGHGAVGLDEAAHKAEAGMSSGVEVVVVEVERHSKHTSVELPQVAVADTEGVAVVAVVGSDPRALHLEKCCDAVPQVLLPASSSRPFSCSADVRDSLPQQSQDLRISSCDVNVLSTAKVGGRKLKKQQK